MLDHKDKFASLDMLPILAYAITGGLGAAKEQLSQLRRVEKNPHLLDAKTFDRIIYSCAEQTKSIVDEKELCAHWRKEKLIAEQIKLLKGVTANLTEMEKINQQILFLATHYKEYATNKVLSVEEGERILESLTEQLYSPTNLSDTANQQRKSFSLPPYVTYQHEKIKNKGEFYTFWHAEWGEIGHIQVISGGSHPQ